MREITQPAVLQNIWWKSDLTKYVFAILLVIAATLLTFLFWSVAAPVYFLFYFPAIILSAWMGGIKPAMLTALLSAVIVDYFLFAPTHAFALTFGDFIRLSVFIITAAFAGQLSEAWRRSESILLKEREYYAVTLSSIGDAVITTDIKGCITLMNATAEQYTGWMEREALGKPLDVVFKIINEETRAVVESPVSKVLRENKVVGLANHTVLLRRDGSEISIDDSGAPIRDTSGTVQGVVLVFRDVSQHKQTETLIHQQAALLEQTHDAVFVWEFGNKILYWYRGAELLYGWSRQEAVGSIAQELLHTTSSVSWSEVETILRTAGRWDGELNHVAKDGRQIVVQSSLSLVKYDNGLTAVLETNRDITERKQSEQELQRINQELKKAINARDVFLSVAAHELKTPLTSLRGFAQMNLRQIDKKQTVDLAATQRAFQTIDRQAARLTRLINQLLDLSRIQSHKLALIPEKTDLAGLVREVIETIQNNAKQHTLVVSGLSTLTTTLDPLRMEQVVTNLVDNAIKYSPDGGIVTVDLSLPDANTIQLTVTDQGVGIPPEKRENLFEQLYQAHLEMHLGGLGLGLYLSKEIVEQHGGTISYEPMPDKGSRFIVRLPYCR